MRDQSQTLIGTLRDAVDQWRRREDWTREAVVDAIVQAHDKLGGTAVTRIKFDPETRDPFERMKVNADRVFRWLDDVSKDSTLLPTNFLPSILAALPFDLRLHCANALLRQAGLEARGAELGEGASIDVASDLRSMTKEGAEAQIALVGLTADAPVHLLENALREVQEAREAHASAERDLKNLIAAKKGEQAGGSLRAV